MTSLFYRPTPGEPAVVAGSLLVIPHHEWIYRPDHQITITSPPHDETGWAYGHDQHGYRVQVWIAKPGWQASPAMLMGSSPRMAP